jgi:uncharacterized iron-regulated protein
VQAVLIYLRTDKGHPNIKKLCKEEMRVFVCLGLLELIAGLRPNSNPDSLRASVRDKIFKAILTPLTITSAYTLLSPAKSLSAECVCGVRSCSCDDLTTESALLDSENVVYDPNFERIYCTNHLSYIPARPEKFLPRELQDKRVIAIGEQHNHPVHHRIQFEVIKSVVQLRGAKNVAVGLESFYRQHQAALDRFVFHHHDLAQLKLETNWDSNWGWDLNYYAKLFKYAALNNVRLVGLNVPLPVAKLVSKLGMEDLPVQLKEVLPDLDLKNVKHREQFMESMMQAGHGNGNNNNHDMAALQRMYETQTLWDEYMSESAALYLKQFPQSTLVVIAGLGHIKGRVAIPDRIARRVQDAQPFVIVPQPVHWSKESGLPLVTEPLPSSEADWVWYTQREIAIA